MEAHTIEQWHRDYAGALFVFALRRLQDRGAAEEVVQDTLVRAWRSRDYDPARGSVDAWLFTIANRLVIDQYRRRGARPRTTGTTPEDALDGRGLAPDAPLTDGDVDRAIEAWQLADALRGLSADHRDAVVMVHYEGLTVRETASRLDVPEGTVKSRVYYGLRSLRLHLEEAEVMG